MAAGSTDVVIRFLSDVSDMKTGINNIEGTLGKFKSGLKGVGLALGAAFSVKKIGDFIDAAEEANAAQAKLTKALQNAGDATGQYAKHAADLANTLQYKTGIDDEVIKGGQTILATFHDLSGELGQQSGLFDRATKASLDMSKAGFGSVDSAATMLGKALQDPEKGLTALGRAGIQFSEDQKAAIKALVESGDKAAAMNLIMQNVEGQVGGVAEASVTASDKMRVAWGETQEAIGNALLPVLQQLAPVLATIAMFVQQNATWLVPLVAGIASWIALQSVLNSLMAAFGIELGIATGWLALIVIAIAAVVAAVILLYAKWDQVWSFIGGLPWYVKVAGLILLMSNPVILLTTVVAALGVYWTNIWSRITAVTSAAWGVLSAVFTAIATTVGWMVNVIAAALSVVARIVDVSLVQPFRSAWDAINSIVGWISDAVGRVVGAVERIKDAVSSLPGAGLIGDVIGAIPGLQAGGIVTRPTLAMIGERGPEAVIPLTGGGSRSGGGNITINITTTGLGADAPAIQSAVVAALRGYTTRNGPIAGIAG